MTANRAVDWLVAAAALANSFSSWSEDSTSSRSPAIRSQARAHLGFLPGRGLHEDAVQATLQTGEFLCVFQRRERDRAVDQRADLLFVELCVERGFGVRAADLEGHDLAEGGHADRLGDRRRQHDGAETGEGRQRRALDQRAAEFGEARIGAHELHGLAALGPDGVRARFDQPGREAHALEVAHLREHLCVEAVGVTRGDLQAGLADDAAVELAHRARQAGAGDLRGEQQPDAGRDADDREDLLQRPRAQAHAV